MSISEQAFPSERAMEEKGMTLREWYAGLAMQGLIVSRGARASTDDLVDVFTKNAFQIADAMVAEEEPTED